jgi:hypothetical protein
MLQFDEIGVLPGREMAVDMTNGLQFFDPGSDGVNGSQAAAGTRDTLLQQSGRLRRDERDRGGNAWRVVHFSLANGKFLLLWRRVTLHERSMHRHAFFCCQQAAATNLEPFKNRSLFWTKKHAPVRIRLEKIGYPAKKKHAPVRIRLEKIAYRQEKKTRIGSNKA